MNYRNK